MRRGTTPTIKLKSDIANIELHSAYLTLKQRGTVIEKTLQDMTIDGEWISCTLTQQETLSLTAGVLELQLRCLSKGGTAYASQVVEFPVEKILKDGEIS
nr:MAG TPA: hypothetical protein [Caudoviricetes sp.]